MALNFPSDSTWLLSARCLVVGAKGSGKTSLLFQYALKLACQGRTCLFVCRSRDKMTAAPPNVLLAEKLSEDRKGCTEDDFVILQRILLKYVENEQQLRNLLISFHLGPIVHALFVDDIDMICSAPAPLPSTLSQASPSKNVKQHAMMRLVGVVALAAHAADFLEARADDARGAHEGGSGRLWRASSVPPAGSARSKVAPSQQRDHSKPSLMVALSPESCGTPLLSRFLPTVMQIAPLSQEPRNAGCTIESTCASLQAVRRSKLLFRVGGLHLVPDGPQELLLPPDRLGFEKGPEQ